MYLKKLITVSILFLSVPAWSLMEVRMTYTSLVSDPDKSLLYNGTGLVPDTTPVTGLGGDLVFNLPLAGLDFGIRYENLGLNFKEGAIEFDGGTSRTSAILGWRWIDTGIYFGPVLTYGVSHSGGGIKVTENGTTISDLTSDSQTSYSAGLQLGAKLIGFRVGIEAGYMNLIWKNLSGTSGSITSLNKLDMSGSYGKFTIGFGI